MCKNERNKGVRDQKKLGSSTIKKLPHETWYSTDDYHFYRAFCSLHRALLSNFFQNGRTGPKYDLIIGESAARSGHGQNASSRSPLTSISEYRYLLRGHAQIQTRVQRCTAGTRGHKWRRMPPSNESAVFLSRKGPERSSPQLTAP